MKTLPKTTKNAVNKNTILLSNKNNPPLSTKNATIHNKNKSSVNETLRHHRLFSKDDKIVNQSTYSTVSNEVFNMDLNSLKEMIELLKKHEDKSNLEGRFIEASLIKERIEKLKKIEEIKVFDMLRNKHEQNRNQLLIEQEDILSRFNNQYDEIFKKMNSEYEELEKRHNQECEYEMQSLKNDVVGYYPKDPKPSGEIIKKYKEMESLQKLKK